jgi:hypothetical protein
MTTDHQMAMMYAAQQEVITALRSIGEVDLADRLERCMTARRDRSGSDGWPFSCPITLPVIEPMQVLV